MTYHSISEGSTLRALAMASIVGGRGSWRPFSIRLIVEIVTPDLAAKYVCVHALLRRQYRRFLRVLFMH